MADSHDDKGRAIPPTMTLSALMRKFPDALDILVKHGFLLETLDEARKRRGIPEGQFEGMLSELNSLALAIRLTDAARREVLDIMRREGKEGHSLRVRTLQSEFGGYSYEFSFEQPPEAGDTILECGGLKLHVDKETLERMRGTLIDFIETPQGKGFKVHNPGAPSGCSSCSGCGD